LPDKSCPRATVPNIPATIAKHIIHFFIEHPLE
jgi:hypothetical protein